VIFEKNLVSRTEAFLTDEHSSVVSPMLSLIIPTYNESENIVDMVNKVETLLSCLSFEIIIVDDNSPDGTGNIAHALNHKHGNIKILTRRGKLGLSSAVLYGFENACSDVMAVIDADMQHPPEVLLEMYEKISEGYDLVVASRYIDGGRIENWNLRRKFISMGANKLANILLPCTRRIRDVMSGCFMIRRGVVENTNLNPIGFKILLEILGRCKIEQVSEIPYTFTNRRNGESNLNQREIVNFLIHVSKLVFNLSRSLSTRHVDEK
jgi:dolichol-phosphate mannosyltransferase